MTISEELAKEIDEILLEAITNAKCDTVMRMINALADLRLCMKEADHEQS